MAMFGIVVACFLLYLVYTRTISPAFYWKRRGVFHVNLYERIYKLFLSDKSFLEIVREAYERFPERRYYGSFHFFRPSLFVRDLDLAKRITIKDFDHFHDHFSISTSQVDPVANQNLFALEGQKWRDMRTTLSPAFTSNKMRQMFTLMAATAENYTNFFLDGRENEKIQLEMKNFYCKYTNDVIASCAFGIECDSLKNKDNEFFKMGQVFSTVFSGRRVYRLLINGFVPIISRIFKISLFPNFVTEFFKRIVRDTIAYREENGIIRPDLIHLLMEANKGKLQHDENDSETVGYATVEESFTGKIPHNKTKLTDDLITAQALVFFFAGFETSSTLLSFASYELALKRDVQTKLQQEIDETMSKTKGKLDYDAILKMKYLDQVVSETLRVYPPGFALNRICTKNYMIKAKLPHEKDILIEKGCLVIIPVYGFQMNPDFFPDPDKFDPERFSEENKSNIIPGTYIPFGSGPRNCIGSRFALLEIKAILVSLLSNFNFVRTEKTEEPLKLAKNAILGTKNGIWLAFEKRKRIVERENREPDK